MNENIPVANTDRELWREREGDYYADSIHVTASGGIGINCGGFVYVKPLRGWFELAGGKEAFRPKPDARKPVTRADQWTPEQISQFNDHTVQCRCGWWGKVSALKALPDFRRGCPDCSAPFNPTTDKLEPVVPGKPL